MATLKEYYDIDFTHVLNVASTVQITGKAWRTDINVRVHLDFDSNTTYLSCFVPECSFPHSVAVGILENLTKLLACAESVDVGNGYPGEEPMSSKDLRFSGRVFLYSVSPIPTPDLERLIAEARSNGVALQFRGPTFAEERSALEKPLAFISHDSRDKDAVARPVAMGLAKLMCPVWFDEFSLKVGDRLRESIEKGIRECNKCILILSPSFLTNSGWTKTEFNSIFTRELIEGTDFLLPIWHGVDKRQIFDYSPTLVDRLGVDWALGETEVVRRLYSAIVASD